VQITLSESFGVGGRGAFYESAGCLRDVIENHLFQIVALLAMEPPAGRHFVEVQTEKATVLKAMRALKPADMVRGQYNGYGRRRRRKELRRETYCAVRLFIDSWRWMVCRGICALENICPLQQPSSGKAEAATAEALCGRSGS